MTFDFCVMHILLLTYLLIPELDRIRLDRGLHSLSASLWYMFLIHVDVIRHKQEHTESADFCQGVSGVNPESRT